MRRKGTMPASKNSFFDHVKWFRKAALEAHADGFIALDNLHAYVRQGDRRYTFFPQFQTTVAGQLTYQQEPSDESSMFVGWRPYRMKQWDIAADKLTFKRFAAAAGLRTPHYWLEAHPDATDVVVKATRSSFGQQVLGPFRNGPKEHPLDFAAGQYYEEFIEGRLLKIWYWNAQPICAELDARPTVLGNGVASLRELVLRRASQHRQLSADEQATLLERTAILLEYQGCSLDTVLPTGVRQVVEFRYGAGVMHPADRRVLTLLKGKEPAWLGQAQHAGSLLYAGIPDAMRHNTVFTIDAILPTDGSLQLLEMNCNPTVHPLVYPAMAASLMQKRVPAAMQ
jgi:hypothetical protein